MQKSLKKLYIQQKTLKGGVRKNQFPIVFTSDNSNRLLRRPPKMRHPFSGQVLRIFNLLWRHLNF
jgi:hypothetical protein